MGELELTNFFCPNENCKDYGLRNQGNIGVRATYGKNNRRLLYCKTCRKRFAETRCTAFFGSKYPRETTQNIIRVVAEGNGVRATARILDLSKDGVNHIIVKAGEHCDRVLSNLLVSLNLTEVQLDEMWTFIKKTEPDAGGCRKRVRDKLVLDGHRRPYPIAGTFFTG